MDDSEKTGSRVRNLERKRGAPKIHGKCRRGGCERFRVYRGFCKAHYREEKDSLPPVLDQKELFWSKTTRVEAGPGQCWEWKGKKRDKGYGQVERNQKIWRAHRYSWFITHGEIPAGMSVLHHCDNPPCVRPDHLWLGTIAQNNADMAAKARAWWQNGHRNYEGSPRTLYARADLA